MMRIKGGSPTLQILQPAFEERVKNNNFSAQCKLTFFEQEMNEIFIYDPVTATWLPMMHPVENMKAPSGIYAAIGTRDLNDAGKAFIDSVFNQ